MKHTQDRKPRGVKINHVQSILFREEKGRMEYFNFTVYLLVKYINDILI